MQRPILKVDGLIDAIDRYIMKADEDLEEQLEAEGYVSTDVAVATINAIEDEVTEVLNKNCDDVLDRLQTATGLDNFIDDIWPTIKDEDDLEMALIEILHDKFEDLLKTCVQQFLIDADEELGIDDRITKPAQHFIETWSEQLAEIMHLNTNEQIEKILLDSQKKAMSITEVADAIADSAIRTPGYRSRRVAVTEVLRVESYSQLEYMRQDPAVEEKEWVHTGNHKNKPRENHVAINGQRVKKDQPFTLVGADGVTYSPMCPRDTCLPASESIHCHCIMRSIRSEKKMGMTVEERRALRQKYMDEVDAEYEARKAQFDADYGDNPDVSWETYNSYFENL